MWRRKLGVRLCKNIRGNGFMVSCPDYSFKNAENPELKSNKR
jgi:hypothetical protein